MLPAETLILAGPTGAGKTALALRIAERLGGEIVGADAFQIYRGLAILTAQPSAAEQAQIPHHLVGSVDPRESFDAGRYRRLVLPILKDISSRGRIPMLVGGSGLYLKALLGGLEELPGNDPALRKEMVEQDLPTLVSRLRAADPAAADQIDLLNRRRVERALEIVLLTGKPLSCSRTTPRVTPPEGVRGLLLIRDREDLNARIADNVRAMFDRGVEEEVAGLPPENIGPTASMTLGLGQIRSMLRGEATREETMEAVIAATRRYAKRQMTWFRNQHDFPVINLTHFPAQGAVLEECLRLLGRE